MIQKVLVLFHEDVGLEGQPELQEAAGRPIVCLRWRLIRASQKETETHMFQFIVERVLFMNI